MVVVDDDDGDVVDVVVGDDGDDVVVVVVVDDDVDDTVVVFDVFGVVNIVVLEKPCSVVKLASGGT